MTESSKGDTSVLIAMAVAGRTMPEIAEACGLSVSSVQRRLATSEIAEAVLQERRVRTQRLIEGLATLSDGASRRLADLIDHEDPQIALRACTVVLGNAIKAVQHVDIVQRLAALERAAVDAEGGGP